jgi:flagellar basal-body rod protein FlgG
MVDMIQTQRTYEMNSKAVSAADSMLQFLTNTI